MALFSLLFAATLAIGSLAHDHDGHDHGHEYDAVIAIAVDKMNPPTSCLPGNGCGLYCTLAYDIDVDGSALTLTPAGNEPELVNGPVTCDCSSVNGTGAVNTTTNSSASGTLQNGDDFTLAWNGAGTLLELTIDTCTNSYTLVDGHLLGKMSSEFNRPFYPHDNDDRTNLTLLTGHSEPSSCDSHACIACFQDFSALVAHDLAILEPKVESSGGCDCASILVVYDLDDEMAGYGEDGNLTVLHADTGHGHDDEIALMHGGCTYHYEVSGEPILGVDPDDGHGHGHGHGHEYDAVMAIAVDPENPPTSCLSGDCGLFCTLAYDVDVDGMMLTLTPAANEQELVMQDVTCDCSSVNGTGMINNATMTASGTLQNGEAFTLGWNAGNTLLELTFDSCTNSYTLVDGHLLGKMSSQFNRPFFPHDDDDLTNLTLLDGHTEPASCESNACLGCFEDYTAFVAHDMAVLQPKLGGVGGCLCASIIVVYDLMDEMAGFDENGILAVLHADAGEGHDDEISLIYGNNPNTTCTYHYEVSGEAVLGVGGHGHDHSTPAPVMPWNSSPAPTSSPVEADDAPALAVKAAVAVVVAAWLV